MPAGEFLGSIDDQSSAIWRKLCPRSVVDGRRNNTDMSARVKGKVFLIWLASHSLHLLVLLRAHFVFI